MKKQRTSAKVKAKAIAKLLRDEHPDYNYLKSVFRHLRTELNIEVLIRKRNCQKFLRKRSYINTIKLFGKLAMCRIW